MRKITLKEAKKICLKKKDCIVMSQYRKLSIRITMHIYRTGILPWHITRITLGIGLIGAWFFLLGEWIWLIAGAILLQLSFLLDCVDGEIARINKTGSAFGAWLDARVDYFTVACIIGAAATGQFFLNDNTIFLTIGIIALINFSMVSSVISTRIAYVERSDLTPVIGNRRYIGNRSLSVIILTIAALTNTIFYALLLFATVWGIIWIKIVIDFYKIAKDKKVKK